MKGRSKRHQSSHSGTFSPRNKAAMFVLLFVFPFAFSFFHAPVLRRVEGSMWEGKEGVEKRLREGSSGEEIKKEQEWRREKLKASRFLFVFFPVQRASERARVCRSGVVDGSGRGRAAERPDFNLARIRFSSSSKSP